MSQALANSDFRELIRDAEDNGFTFVRRSKHQLLYADRNGAHIGIPTSPSDYRSLRNSRADLRRAIRARTESSGGEPMETTNTTITIADQPATSAAAEYVRDRLPALRSKTCKVCGETKDPSAFGGRRDHPHETCTSCTQKVRIATLNAKNEARIAALQAVRVGRENVAAPAAPAAPEPKTGELTPEMMATRLIVRRHQAEYDALLVDMMTALGWDAS